MFSASKSGLVVAAVVAMTFASAQEACAGTVTSLYGDKDAFGIPGASPAVPADGTLWRDGLGGVFFSDYRDAGDLATAPLTDRWFSPGGVNSLTFSYGLPTSILSATLSMQIAGIADVSRGPYDVFYNSTNVGQIPTNPGPNAFQEVRLYSFVVPVGLLTGSDTVSFTAADGGDGWSMNFSELTIETRMQVVPLPGAAWMGLGLLASLAVVRRRRR